MHNHFNCIFIGGGSFRQGDFLSGWGVGIGEHMLH